MKNYFILLFISFLLLLGACKTTILTVEDIIPSLQIESVKPYFKQTDSGQIHTGLIVSTRYRNPYNKSFEIPPYSIQLLVKTKKKELRRGRTRMEKPRNPYTVLLNKEISLDENNRIIPPKDIKITIDTLDLDTEDLSAIMGYEDIFELSSEIEIDLSKYVSLLPDYEIMVSENFHQNTSKPKPFLESVAQKKLGKYKYSLHESISAKVPKLPEVTMAEGLPVKIVWMGESFTLINPDQIKNYLEAFANALLQQEFSGVARGFVDSLETIKITIPITNQEIVLKESIFNMAQVFFPAIRTQYEEMKEILPKNGEKVTDFMVEHYMPGQQGNWDTFKENWENLQNIEIPNGIPSPNTVGFKIIFPLELVNTNDFEISVPCFKNAVEVGNQEILSIQLRARSYQDIDLDRLYNEKIILDGNERAILFLSFSLNWSNSASGIYNFLSGQTQNGNMRGMIGFDFGYGPMYLYYDLDGMNVNFEH